MGRKNGTWSPIYGQAWTHPKTTRAAKVVTDAGHRERYAAFLVIGWLHRLNIWCLANDERGVIAGLTDAKLAAAVWPESLEDGMPAPRAGQLVRAALLAGGFIEDSPDGPRVHEFQAFHARLLKDRGYQRIRDEESGDTSGDESGDPSPEPSGATGTGTGIQEQPEEEEPPTPAKPGAPGGRRPKGPPSPAEAAARALSTALGSSLNACRKAIASFVAAGWGIDRIQGAITEHAQPGDAPWDWAKRARGATQAPSLTKPDGSLTPAGILAAGRAMGSATSVQQPNASPPRALPPPIGGSQPHPTPRAREGSGSIRPGAA